MESNKPIPTSDPEKTSEARDYNEVGLDRMIFFSDGIFAIAITLLTLEIHFPPSADGPLTDAELLQALLALGPKYLGFIISFLVVGVFWMGHHRRYQFIKRYDGMLLSLNLLLLMGIVFIPFPTSIISEHGNRTGTIFYALSIMVIGLLNTLVWWYASHNHRLIAPDVPEAQIRHSTRRLLIPPIIFLLSIGVAFIDTDLAKLSWILIIPALTLIH